MTEVSDRYSRVADAFEARLRAVPADQWDAATPCSEWTVRDLVGHVVHVHRMVLSLFHTWDLAQATGQDERLDPDADAQTQLLCFGGCKV